MRCHKAYFSLDQMEDIFDGSAFTNTFYSCHFFDGTLTYTDPDGNIVTLPDLGFKPADLTTYWINYYRFRKIAIPAKVNPFSTASQVEAAAIDVRTVLNERAELFFKANKYKYITLVKSLGYEYDPISNYDMREIKGAASKIGKSETTESMKGGLVTDVDAPTTKQGSYSTTYDDASTGRLAGYGTNEYYDANYRKDSGNIPIIRTKQTVENEGDGKTYTTEYKDDEVTLTVGDITTPEANTADVYELKRSGNIGVTTTQQMIESERELAKINLIKDFFNDFNKEVLLSTWD